MGRHGARARREARPRPALLPPRLARRADGQAPARAARDEHRAAVPSRRTTRWSRSSTRCASPRRRSTRSRSSSASSGCCCPRKIAAYTYHLNGTSRITDSPTQRSLGFMLQDEFEDWREGEMLLQSLIETPEERGAGDPPPAGARSACCWRPEASRGQVPLAAVRSATGRSLGMRKQLPPEMLARDSRFVRTSIMDQVMDPRNQMIGRARPRLGPAPARASRRRRPGPQPDARHLHR